MYCKCACVLCYSAKDRVELVPRFDFLHAAHESLQRLGNFNGPALRLIIFQYSDHGPFCRDKRAVQGVDKARVFVCFISKSYAQPASLIVNAIGTGNYLTIGTLASHPRLDVISFSGNLARVAG